jgi:Putative transposase/Transposase zinc-binding domain
VIELADVFRRFADGYLSSHGAAMPAWHRRAIADILSCRTEVLGGHLWRCDQCSHEVFSYHSCRHRSCPKCHTRDTAQWLEARRAELLNTDYFHVVVTVPQELRTLLRANQSDAYSLLMKAAADAIIELARDRRFVGATVGVLAVLHTWTQQLAYHPHVHCLVTGGGVSDDGRYWQAARDGFLVPIKALAKLVRGKLKALLASKRPDLIVPRAAWTKPWVVHITHWGRGADAVLRYLARYVFRTAITNARIVNLDADTVTFKYRERKSSRWRTCRLDGHEFMRRFLQHVLPPGFHKVRYCGLWHPSKRDRLARARLLLELEPAASPAPTAKQPLEPKADQQTAAPAPRTCPCCGLGHLVYVRRLTPKNALGP